MTKVEAVRSFRRHIMPTIWVIERRQSGLKDQPLRNQAWNDYKDALYKEGNITDWQYNNWTHPRSMRKACGDDLIGLLGT